MIERPKWSRSWQWWKPTRWVRAHTKCGSGPWWKFWSKGWVGYVLFELTTKPPFEERP